MKRAKNGPKKRLISNFFLKIVADSFSNFLLHRVTVRKRFKIETNDFLGKNLDLRFLDQK